MTQFSAVLGMIMVCVQAHSQIAGRLIHPPDPAEEAKRAQARELIAEAKLLVKANDDSGAISKLLEAAAVEATLTPGFQALAQHDLARMYVKQNRLPEALAAYRSSFIWRPAGYYGTEWRGDLDLGGNPGIEGIVEYAILLARQGRAEDAKAMYYYGLRAVMGPSSRSQEPTPFLVVFDPDPEGVYWEYTPERLEAAALMVEAMRTDGVTDFATNVRTTVNQLVDRVRTLAPDWFYPVMFKANRAGNGSAREQQLLAEAQGLAKPGLEVQLMAGFRQSLEDWRLYCEQNNLAHGMATDNRPMIEGAERRKRMQCLRPNEQILRRLSIERLQ